MPQNVVGSITSQGSYLGCRFHPKSEPDGRQMIDVSPSH